MSCTEWGSLQIALQNLTPGCFCKLEQSLSHTRNSLRRLMFINQEGSVQVRIHDTLGDCHLAKVAHAAPSNPKYSHARARLWRQTLRGGHSLGFPSSTKQPNPHVGSPGVAGARGISTKPLARAGGAYCAVMQYEWLVHVLCLFRLWLTHGCCYFAALAYDSTNSTLLPVHQDLFAPVPC